MADIIIITALVCIFLFVVNKISNKQAALMKRIDELDDQKCSFAKIVLSFLENVPDKNIEPDKRYPKDLNEVLMKRDKKFNELKQEILGMAGGIAVGYTSNEDLQKKLFAANNMLNTYDSFRGEIREKAIDAMMS